MTDIQEIYDLIFSELGVTDDKDTSRINEFHILVARAIFCRISKEMGYDTFTIGEIINRDFSIVNKHIKDIISREWKTDFISKCIITRYNELKDLIKHKYYE